MTREEAEDIVGICTACGEHCSLADTCCGMPIYYEGGTLSPDLIEDDREDV